MCSKKCENCGNMDEIFGCLFGRSVPCKNCGFIPVINPVFKKGSSFLQGMHGVTIKEANDKFAFFTEGNPIPLSISKEMDLHDIVSLTKGNRLVSVSGSIKDFFNCVPSVLIETDNFSEETSEEEFIDKEIKKEEHLSFKEIVEASSCFYKEEFPRRKKGILVWESS